jgi:CubicO group peptidase (beta-lactamase class C family)
VRLGEAKMLITIRHLLTHTSGIGSSDSGKNAFLSAEDKKSALRLSKHFAQLGVDFEPGSTQFYSGVAAFAVLGAIIEQVSGQSLQDFYTKEIFEPCGMKNTTFIPTKEQWSKIIDMHGRDENGNNIAVPMHEGCIFADYPCEHCVAGAGLVSTLADYTKFATMLFNQGKTLTGRIVQEDIFKEMAKPQVKIDPMTYWGFGVRVIGEGHPYLSKGSFGWSGAYGSHFWVDVENEIVAVFMKNSTVDGGAGNASSRNFESAVKRSLL